MTVKNRVKDFGDAESFLGDITLSKAIVPHHRDIAIHYLDV